MTSPRNVFGWHVSASNLAILTPEAYATSAVIKVLVEGHTAFRLREVRDKAPHALIVARLIDVDQEERELHARAYRREDPTATGHWFADVIAGLAKPLGLEFVIWESGPNELNAEGDPWWARYCLSFLARMREHGLIAALGGESFGRPKIPPYDGVDEWEQGGWIAVVDAIDYVNRSAGRVVAYKYIHEYSGPRDVRQAMGFHLTRYRYLYDTHVKPRNKFVPLLITEWNYAQPGDPLPNTEERIDQMLWLNGEYAKDEYLAGVTTYFLEDNQPPEWDVRHLVAPYSQKMISGGYEIRHPKGPSIVEVPPPPPPQPDTGEGLSAVVSVSGLRLRQAPSLSGLIIYQMANGTLVKVLGQGSAWHWIEVVVTVRWYQVDIPVTLRGYSASQYLRIVS